MTTPPSKPFYRDVASDVTQLSMLIEEKNAQIQRLRDSNYALEERVIELRARVEELEEQVCALQPVP